MANSQQGCPEKLQLNIARVLLAGQFFLISDNVAEIVEHKICPHKD
jgi:hypothetical protein